MGVISEGDDYHPVLRFDIKGEHNISEINFEYVKNEVQRYIIEDVFALEIECNTDYLRVRVIPALVQFTINHIRTYKYKHYNADIGWYLWSLGF